jgi:hypothetical protein
MVAGPKLQPFDQYGFYIIGWFDVITLTIAQQVVNIA